VAYVAGWKQILDGRIVSDSDRAADPVLAAEGAAWVADLHELDERGWGVDCLRGCSSSCRCVDRWGTVSDTGRQAL
jgi:hypothetical protein